MEFNYSKNKILFFDIEVEGLDEESISFYFSILVADVKYSFKGDYKGGRVKFEIPPFKTFLKDKIVEEGKSYEAEMIVYDDNILLTPWNSSIKFEVSPEVTAKLTSENKKIKTEKPLIKVSEINSVIEQPDKTNKKENKEPTKEEVVKFLTEKFKSFSKPSKKKKKKVESKKVIEKPIEENKTDLPYEIKDQYTKEDVSKLMFNQGMTEVKFQDKLLESLEFSKGITDPNAQYSALLSMFGLIQEDKNDTGYVAMKFLQEKQDKN